MMRKINTKILWLIVAICFVIAVGLIVGVTYTTGVWTNVLIVLLAICFIVMTIAVQMASTQTFRYRAKPPKYITKTYTCSLETLEERLKKEGYQPRKVPYGTSYLKIAPPLALKAVIVEDSEAYFRFSEESSGSEEAPNPRLKKCSRFIGTEIFLHPNEEALKKLPDFCIQGENIYYSSYKTDENGNLVCPNFIEPTPNFKEALDVLLENLGLKEEKKDEQVQKDSNQMD